MNETQTLELTTQTVAVEKLDTAKPLAEIFQPFQATLEKWKAKAESLVVTDIGQKTEMAQARLARLELREARVTMDKTRKGLVEHLNARVSAINGAARTIRESIESLETKLLESEQFAERHAAKLKAELKLKRETEIAPFLDTPILGDLSDLTEEQYGKALDDAKLLRQAKLDAAAKIVADRLAKAEADRKERERIEAENARLKAEAEETARLAEIERKRIEQERAEERRKAEVEQRILAAKAQAERAELERLGRIEMAKFVGAQRAAEFEAAKAKKALDLKLQAEAQEKARIERERKASEAAARKAAAAPDKIKLEALAATVRKLPVPTINNASLTSELRVKIESLACWIEAQIENL